MQRRWDQARRLIRDNGVTYNVYGDPRGMHRPWELDPVPLILRSTEFARLAAGLTQRARVLDAIVHDLHGEQRLLTRRLLPPELVLGNPGFLRPLVGTLAPGSRAIELLATDVARRDDGGFVALGDRVQSPSGAGYAVENRIVVSRVLPGPFRELRVQRVAGWFRTLRDSLRELAPRGREQPRIVVLTPGPHNETYFEHSYLARYLGFSLVEGADLTVRDLKVWVKTLGGLERVDVILRRLDDAFADPLALRADSTLGVAGLSEAVRAGNVAVANALGAGVVESPALLAFLPRLCRELLGEDLALPSVPTTWCGDPAALPGVLERLPSLVIKPAFPGAVAFEPVFAGRVGKAERAGLAERIRRSPERFVAQEQVSLSTAPVWNGDRLEPRHV
ncbi:MAG: circularly permuted type 2 ATP-grasp protein, partial [Deltaproteobacteria bacterium]|nr:circularly permuted type 2 ATP-grasp protein [Deltaproteobacteria bacterium]